MISFVTLFARDIERTADVYRLLGFKFVQEQHGSGPRHLAAVNEGMVPVWRDIESTPGMRRIIVVDPERRQIFIRERARS